MVADTVFVSAGFWNIGASSRLNRAFGDNVLWRVIAPFIAVRKKLTFFAKLQK